MSSLLIGGARRFARCWRIERMDGTVLGFTDHGSLLVVDGENYSPLGTIEGTAEAHREGTHTSNRDLSGALRSDRITESDLRAGKYRNAEVREFVVDWQYPFAGKFYSRTYTIENTKFSGEAWKATIVSMRERLELTVGHTLQKTCKVEKFGNTLCGVNKAAFTVTGRSVTSVVTQRLVVVCDVSASYADDWFEDGEVTWTSGANTGLVSEVKRWTSTTQRLELYAPTPKLIQVGDDFNIVRGCNRLFDTCDRIFGNAKRFRGFPDIPGTDKVVETADSTE